MLVEEFNLMDYRKDNKIHRLTSLQEDTRTQLISKSKSSVKGRERYKKRTKSRVANSVRQYNSIDMNKLFKDNILTVDILVNGETDDYTVRVSFGGFLDFLYEELSRNNAKLDLRTITRALVRGFNQDNVYIHCSCPDFCLQGDTKIQLINGELVTIRDLKSRIESGEDLYTYSVNEQGDFSPSKINWVWISGFAKEFIAIEVDEKRVTLTTPTHKYMLADGTYESAAFLKVGQELMGIGSSHKITNVGKVCFENNEPTYDINVSVNSNFMVDGGAILHNCYRFAYWATRNKINSGDPQPSNGQWIRNPNDMLGSACKHVLLVLSNNSWLLKVASVINNYVNYMSKHRQRMYADIIYPAIYKKKYEEPVQTSMFDDDKLETDKETIDTSNEEGRTSGQFKQGNEYRFRPQETNKDQISIEDIDEEE